MTKLAEAPALRFEPWDIESEWLHDHGGQLEQCLAGEHEDCAGTLDAGATRILRCACGCHTLDPAVALRRGRRRAEYFGVA